MVNDPSYTHSLRHILSAPRESTAGTELHQYRPRHALHPLQQSLSSNRSDDVSTMSFKLMYYLWLDNKTFFYNYRLQLREP